MSRRKQAKPRALKTEENHLAVGVEPGISAKLYKCEGCGLKMATLKNFMDHRNFECVAMGDEVETCAGSTAAVITSKLSESEEAIVAMETENSMESDGTCPREVSSWQSEDTPEDDLLSLSPSSCVTPTPNDPDCTVTALDQLSFSVGVTESTPYPCQFCDKAFPRLSYLKRHEQSHGDQMPFKCNFCHRLFKHKRSRDRHIKLHTGDKKYRCPHCEAAFSRSDHLKIHMKTHDNAKPFQCTVCNRGYNTAAALTSHMQNHKKDLISPLAFRCMQCAAAFPNSQQLQEHTTTTHGSGSLSPNIKQESVTRDEELKSEHALGAETLNEEQLSSVENYYQHFKVHSSVGDNDELNISTRLNCTHCSKDNFANAEALQLHLKSRHSIFYNGEHNNSNHINHHSSSCSSSSGSNCSRSPQYSPSAVSTPNRTSKAISTSKILSSDSIISSLNCDYCTMKFSSTQALQKHTLSVHSFNEVVVSTATEACKEFVCCPHCTMAFSNAVLLAEHVQCVHSHVIAADKRSNGTGSKHGSGKTANSSNNNNNSMVTIKTEKLNGHGLNPIQQATTLLCNQCSAAVPDFEAFRAHLKTHLDEAVVQKFVCSECQAEFSSEDQLDSHVVGHFLSTTTEYGCQSCLKLFSKPDELQKHLMDIHAHHLYRCALCKEVFDSKVSVQVHFAVKHSNECKLFKCSACSSVFRSEMEFQLHVKVAHLRKVQPFRCFFCNFSYNSELELQCHLTTHKKQFACALCDEAFHVEFLLDRHMSSKHSSAAATSSTTASSSSPVSSTVGAVTSSSASAQINDASVTVKVKSKVTPAAPVTPAACNSTTSVIVCTTSPIPLATSSSTPSQLTVKKELRCDICDLDFVTEVTLNSHRRQVHNIRVSGNQKSGQQQILSLYCAYCNEACKSRTELENHMKVHTVSSGKHKCNICDEVCPTATTLAEHKLTHCKVVSGSMCVTCKVNLKSEDQYYSHLQQHNSQGLPLPCVVCRQTLMSEIEVQMHVKFHLKNAEPLYACCVCRKHLEIINLIVQNGGLYVCKECFHCNSHHLRVGHGNEVGEMAVENSLEFEEIQARCVECAVKFESMAELEKHKRNCHKKTYQCIKCQMSFDTENEIQLHVTSHMLHEGTDHECRLCSRVFDSPSKLQCHLIEHTFEGCASYACYMCSAVFTTPNLLQQHMLEHGLNSRPYDCSHCHQRFFFRAELENHLFSHGIYELISNNGLDSACESDAPQNKRMKFNGSDGGSKRNSKKPYGCADCGKEFQCLSNLQSHSLRNHSNSSSSAANAKHVCTECNKEFSLARSLALHIKSHHSEFSFDNLKNIPKLKRAMKTKKNNFQKNGRTTNNNEVESSSVSSLNSERVKVRCDNCGKTAKIKKLNSERYETNGDYLCDACQHLVSSSARGKKKSRSIDGGARSSSSYEFACKLCFEIFEKMKDLRRHLKQIHDVDPELDAEIRNSDAASDVSNNSSNSSCSNFAESSEAGSSIGSPSASLQVNNKNVGEMKLTAASSNN